MSALVLPAPEFRAVGVEVHARAAIPTLRVAFEVHDPSGRPVYAMALRVQLVIEPLRRPYTPEARERLRELFGDPAGWASGARRLVWAESDALVQSFCGAGRFALSLACPVDQELAVTRYFGALDEGAIHLQARFNGRVFYENEDGRLQIVQLAWDRDCSLEIPLATWRRAIDAHYPEGRWVRLDPATLERLRRFRTRRGLPSFEAAVAALLAEAEAPADTPAPSRRDARGAA